MSAWWRPQSFSIRSVGEGELRGPHVDPACRDVIDSMLEEVER